MNGQTGKLVGDVPCSMGKFWGILLGAAGGLGLIMFLIAHFLIGLTGAGTGFMVFLGILIGVIIALTMKGKTTSVHKGYAAASYVVNGSFRITGQYDNFIKKETEKKAKNKN